MILSASRRTDIPAYSTDWFRNRLREGFCTVRNPFRPSQVRRVSLVRTDVDAFVFWTRDARPFVPALDDLDREGFPYIFLVTITGYPAPLEPREPSVREFVRAFRDLSRRVGPKRVAWRYDPILLSNLTTPAFHRENFSALARALMGPTDRVIVSVDIGSTDTCPRGCATCYATRSFARAKGRFAAHDPESPELGKVLPRGIGSGVVRSEQ